MANLSFKMPDEFLLKASRLGDKTDEIMPKVLEEGAKVMLKKVESNLSAVIGKGTKYPSRSTGELKRALGVSPAKVNIYGNHDIKIGFTEPRRDGDSNAKIANILEYGKSGQPAKPFLRPARAAGKKLCIDAMIEKLEEELNKL